MQNLAVIRIMLKAKLACIFTGPQDLRKFIVVAQSFTNKFSWLTKVEIIKKCI